jgi:hypothetical protein
VPAHPKNFHQAAAQPGETVTATFNSTTTCFQQLNVYVYVPVAYFFYGKLKCECVQQISKSKDMIKISCLTHHNFSNNG